MNIENPVCRCEDGRLSNDQKPAIKWKDGTGIYLLDGVKFEKETILTAEEWYETRNLYGEDCTDRKYFINRPVYKNRPPASCLVKKNLNTNNYHVFHN